MKKIFYIFPLLILIVLVLCSCDNTEDNNNNPIINNPSITLNYESISMYTSEQFTLVAVVEHSEEEVIWEVSDTEILSINNGVITALKEGNSVVSAKINEHIATCNVKVDKANVFEFSSTSRKVYVNKTTQLNIKHLFKGEEVKNAKVSYQSSNQEIVTVDELGYVTGNMAGEATITATYNNLKTTINITVSNIILLTLNVNEIILNPNKSTNNTVNLTATVKKNGINIKNAAISWSAIDSNLVRINANNSNAKITAIGCGNTAVIAEYEGEVTTCIITSYKEVSTISDMESIKTDINGWFKLVNDIDFTGYSWSSITPWLGDPVNQDLYFGGIFDGQGFTLSNINCLTGWHQGLFGLINKNALVKNVSIVNLVNQATSNKSSAVVALNYGRIENVYAETTIQSDSQTMWNANGGLVATNHPGAVIRNCIAKVNATRVYKNSGALVGYNCGTLENCFAICTDAVLPSVHTTISDTGKIINSYTYSDETMLFGDDLFITYDKSIWTTSKYAIPSLRSYSTVNFNSSETYLTVGKEYNLNPFNVKGINCDWTFDGDIASFDYYLEDDNTLNVLPLTTGELIVNVTLENGDTASTKLISKGVVLVPNSSDISLDYLNPGLDDQFELSFVDEDENYIANDRITYISNDSNVVTVSNSGVIKAVGAGKTTISLKFENVLYSDLIEVNVTEWIQISNPSQLDAIRNNLNAMYCLVNDIDYGGNTFKTIGIWDGIETNSKHFGGTFDGNGYTISNLALPSEGDTSGIWGQTLQTSIIRNVNFINISSPSVNTDNYGIVGFNTGLIENVYIEMNVSSGGNTNIRSGGGIAGTNEYRGIIRNCISVIRTNGINENAYFGSLCGLNQGLLESNFSIVYGNEFSQVNAVSYDNGSVLTSTQYANLTYDVALESAISSETPFGGFDLSTWIIDTNRLPVLKKK